MVATMRRILFTLTLLSIGAFSAGLFQFVNHALQKPGRGGLPAICVFIWGMCAPEIVLATWLVFRTGVWTTWLGRLRAAIYLVAYCYGSMLYYPTQDWWTKTGAVFEWPGLSLADFRHVHVQTLLVFVWLMVPLVVLFDLALSEGPRSEPRKISLSIRTLFGWVTLAAIVLAYTKWNSANTSSPAFYTYIFQSIPMSLIQVAATMAILWGWSKKWYVAFSSLFVALMIDGLGTGICIEILERLTGRSISSILNYSLYERWSFVSGRTFFVWCAFGIAKFTGVTPAMGRGHCAKVETKHLLD